MTELQNPYEAPPGDEGSTAEIPFDPEASFDRRGMLSLIIATGLLAGLDAWIFQLGFIVVFRPPVLFFVLTFWAVISGTRRGSLSVARRIGAATLAALLAAPCFEILLFMTCNLATGAAGVGFRLHGELMSPSERLIFGLITGVMIALVGLLVFWLTHFLPEASRKRREMLQKQASPQADAN